MLAVVIEFVIKIVIYQQEWILEWIRLFQCTLFHYTEKSAEHKLVLLKFQSLQCQSVLVCFEKKYCTHSFGFIFLNWWMGRSAIKRGGGYGQLWGNKGGLLTGTQSQLNNFSD